MGGCGGMAARAVAGVGRGRRLDHHRRRVGPARRAARRPRPRLRPPSPPRAAAVVDAVRPTTASDDDASLMLMAGLSAELDLRRCRASRPGPGGSAEHAVTHMDDDELRELQRLLKQELARRAFNARTGRHETGQRSRGRRRRRCALSCVIRVRARCARGRGQRQGRGAGRRRPGRRGRHAGRVQQMFDAYALMQAQEQLKIRDEQFPQFLARFKALQDVRRRRLQNRTALIVRLRELAGEARRTKRRSRSG